ncbi:MAG: replication-relaxation family protein [Candidatus Saccharimonas sp.]
MTSVVAAPDSSTTTLYINKRQYTFNTYDISILKYLHENKVLVTKQVAKKFHDTSRQFTSSVRLVTRYLQKLHKHKLIDVSVKRFIGGQEKGSTSTIWSISKLGFLALKQIQREKGDDSLLRPYKKLKPHYIKHQLAVNEINLYFQLIAMKNTHLKLDEVAIEEKSWRKYFSYQNRVETSLRPDLFVVTYRGDSKISWFVEVDLASESACRVVEKCKVYVDYFISVASDGDSKDIVPAVLWIVPTEKRRNILTKHIAQNMPPAIQNQDIFIVATLPELNGIVAHGIAGRQEELTYDQL